MVAASSGSGERLRRKVRVVGGEGMGVGFFGGWREGEGLRI